LDEEIVVKRVGTILLLIVFFAQCFAQSFILVKFYVNQSYYQSICENKARPMLHCNGKCQLAKRLKQAEKKDQQNSSRHLDNNNNEVICFPASSYNFCCASLLKNHFGHFQDNHTVEFPVSIFHPPSFYLIYA
jgi:hypothetical protein